jgi:hypothetical protein
MEFTTHFELHSQTTRLQGQLQGIGQSHSYGPYTLSGLEPQSGGLGVDCTNTERVT